MLVCLYSSSFSISYYFDPILRPSEKEEANHEGLAPLRKIDTCSNFNIAVQLSIDKKKALHFHDADNWRPQARRRLNTPSAPNKLLLVSDPNSRRSP